MRLSGRYVGDLFVIAQGGVCRGLKGIAVLYRMSCGSGFIGGGVLL